MYWTGFVSTPQTLTATPMTFGRDGNLYVSNGWIWSASQGISSSIESGVSTRCKQLECLAYQGCSFRVKRQILIEVSWLRASFPGAVSSVMASSTETSTIPICWSAAIVVPRSTTFRANRDRSATITWEIFSWRVGEYALARGLGPLV